MNRDSMPEGTASELFFRLSPDLLAIASVTGRWKRVNPAMSRVLGWSEDEFFDTPMLDIVHPDDLPRSKQALDSVSRGGPIIGFQHRVRCRDGAFRWIAWEAYCESESGLVYCTGRDVTQRKKAEEALRESELRLQLAMKATKEAVWDWDIQRDHVTWNRAYAEAFGRPAAAGDTAEWWKDRVHPEDRPRVISSLREAMERGEDTWVAEYRFLRGDGVWADVYDRACIAKDEQGVPVRVVGAFLDITDRKRAERELRRAHDDLEQRIAERTAELTETNRELERRARELARLSSELTLSEQRERRRLAELLHDHLQQYLVAAKLGLQLLAPRIEKRDQGDFDRIRARIDDSIEFSHSLTGELSPPILRSGGIAAGLDWLAHWMGKTHGFTVELSADPQAATDRDDVRVLVYQSVRELLLNVLKHSGVKRARVELRRFGEDRLAVTVSDEGRGFDPRKALARTPSGHTGFGLFSIRERMALLGGGLEVDSAPSRGARMTLIAPAGGSPGDPGPARPPLDPGG